MSKKSIFKRVISIFLVFSLGIFFVGCSKTREIEEKHNFEYTITNNKEDEAEHFFDAIPGETLVVTIDNNYLGEKYSNLYNKFQSQDIIQEKRDILEDILDSKVEVYIIDIKNIRNKDDINSYDLLYSGKLSKLNTEYIIKKTNLTEYQKSKMSKNKAEAIEKENKYNIVFRFEDEILKKYEGEIIAFPLKITFK